MKIKAADAAAVFLVFLSVALGAYVSTGSFDGYEVAYVRSFQQFAVASGLIPFFKLMTYVGSLYSWAAFAVLLLLVERRRPKRALKVGMFLLGISAVDLAFKVLFARPRPYRAFPNLVQGFENENMSSYPSGHTSRVGGEWYFLRNGRPYLDALLAVLTVLISLSRVALGVHYFTDTLGAFLLSYPLAYLTNRLGLYELALKTVGLGKLAEGSSST